mmetsp:Transcript_128/g.205  ORF Transcript_128/g.205 Transcript_128/m.205 type:complete len:343 (+) Transcript_128:404-1432(+)|eukprot:CAMPEP_0204824094 /NCGR_PEP_ID=MMETSP1346-20131115/2140_1 /ASSEMBLY_ACC=CAM_ASM_000771 /TAXON_ID=215587 /ORGANISM="Aplanochytrium stocchinoi, Strain GSBS06" /LENGTH=342 /DNA_ID=CAMNT_0051951055 /DNA_START=346 /DNA_END=1374 /DNA_ORIENTATION=+
MKVPNNISELVDEAKKKLSMGVTFGDLGRVFVLSSLVLYPVLSPNFLTAEKNTKSKLYNMATGKGVSLVEFLVLLGVYAWMCFEYAVCTTPVAIIISTLIFGWLCPFVEIGILVRAFGKGLEIIGNVRDQLPNILPYHADLLPIAPKLVPYTGTLLLNVDKLGPAMPALMSEKKYIIPVMPQLCEKMDVLLPILDILVANIHKLAPHVEILLPKLEILAPHVEGLMPLWDDLEPRLPILIDEIDNLAPYLGETVPYMDRLIPMLDLLPMIHETGMLKYEIACKSLPTVVRLLPEGGDVTSTYQKYQRMFLQKSSSLLAQTYVKGTEILKSQESRLLEWRKDG